MHQELECQEERQGSHPAKQKGKRKGYVRKKGRENS